MPILAALLLASALPAQTPRFPQPKLEETAGDQRAFAERALKETRVGLGGPWGVLARSPTVGQAVIDLYHYFRHNSGLPARVIEFVILITARETEAPYEWFVHYPISVKEGISEAALASIRAGKRPATMKDDEAAAYDLAIEVLRNRTATDGTFQKAKRVLGEKAVVDITALAGTYAAIGGLLNVAEIWGKTGSEPQYLPLPRKR